MKTIYKYNLAIICALFLITSCEIDDGDDRDVEFTPKLGTATVNLINGVTTADDLADLGFPIDGVDLWVDETKYGQNMQSGDVMTVEHEFPQGTMFRAVHGGQSPTYLTNGVHDYHTILVSNTASDLLPADHNAPLQGQLKDGASYTIVAYAFGALDDHGDYSHMTMIEDDLSAPSGGNAKVRFVNAGGGECWSNTCQLECFVDGNSIGVSTWGEDALAAFGISGDVFTDFVEVSPGTLNIDLENGGASPYFSGTVNVSAGGIYTIVFSGNEIDPVATPEPHRLTMIEH